MSEVQTNAPGRHPSTNHMMHMLRPNPNLKGSMAIIADDFWTLANNLLADLPDSPELTAGLRKLLEAKDCFVRSAVFSDGGDKPVYYTDR